MRFMLRRHGRNEPARGTPANAGAMDISAQRATSAGARCACRHSWTDDAESASVYRGFAFCKSRVFFCTATEPNSASTNDIA